MDESSVASQSEDDSPAPMTATSVQHRRQLARCDLKATRCQYRCATAKTRVPFCERGARGCHYLNALAGRCIRDRESGARFPTLAVEKEFAQATGRAGTSGLTDRQALQQVRRERENRYLVRQLCWVLTIEDLDVYIRTLATQVKPTYRVESLRSTPRATDVDVVIGLRGPIAPPETRNGLQVPIVAVDQLYSFDIDGLLDAMPRPRGGQQAEVPLVGEEVFARLVQLADNAGATDQHRASIPICPLSGDLPQRGRCLRAGRESGTVEVRSSPLTGVRRSSTSPPNTAIDERMSATSHTFELMFRRTSVPRFETVARCWPDMTDPRHV